MTMLADKGLLKQDKSAKTYLYSANIDRNKLTKNIIKTVAEKLLNKTSNNLVSNFLGNRDDISLEEINKLLDEIK
jgi:predicted transcriptional regulator